MIKIVQDRVELKNLRTTWERLASAANVRIFQTYAWCDAAWRFLDDGKNLLYVMVWTQENRAEIVIFPFYVDAAGTLRFIMDEHSDYCDCVYVLGANHHLAFKEAIDAVREDQSIRRVNLSKMDGVSEALNYWGMLLPDSRIVRVNTYSWIDVQKADDFAAAQEQLRSKDKANVRAIRRKADRYRLRVLSRENGDAFPREDIVALRTDMIQSGRRDEGFLSDRFVNFCDEIYRGGGKLLNYWIQPVRLSPLILFFADPRGGCPGFSFIRTRMRRQKCMSNICTSRDAKLTSSSTSEQVDMITNSARSVHTCAHSSRFSTTTAKRRGMRPSVRDSFAA